MKITGCIVTHNNEDLIEPCISSILSSTKNLDFTLYISDNLSTDKTLTIVRENFPSVVIIENKNNFGYGAGHNQVLPFLDSEYHIIINPDIVIPSEDEISSPIAKLAEFLENNLTVAMVTPKILNMDGSEQFLPKLTPSFPYLLSGKLPFMKNKREEYTMKNAVITEPIPIDFCTGCFMFLRTKLFKQLDGFDDRYFMYLEDADLSKEIQAFGAIEFCPCTYVYHNWARSSSKKMKFLVIHIQSMFKFFRKWN